MGAKSGEGDDFETPKSSTGGSGQECPYVQPIVDLGKRGKLPPSDVRDGVPVEIEFLRILSLKNPCGDKKISIVLLLL